MKYWWACVQTLVGVVSMRRVYSQLRRIIMANLPATSSLLRPRKGSAVSPERFSLLLLQFGEIYFEDFGAIYYPPAATETGSVERKQRGRLKLCSQSLLFDPLDYAHPIIMISFTHTKTIKKWRSKDSKLPGNSMVIQAAQYTEMLEGNIIAPHRFIKEERQFLFSLTYGSIDDVLSQILTLQRATSLPKSEQTTLVESIVQTKQAQVSFNTSWLENFYEEQILETYGERVTPLVSNPGRIMLTSSLLYFQPFNNVEVEPVLKVKLDSLTHVMKRRYMLRHVGLELFSKGGQVMFLTFPSTSKRNLLYERLISLPAVDLKKMDLPEMTQKWQTGEVSNFDYLMFLNLMADRSFCDIMQYPVMPWVIADYTSESIDLEDPSVFRDLSKPIGALNKDRLAFYKERYAEMTSNKFLYGTHYSAPGYILYYLVRKAPEYLLCLQNGRFDHPNRLFHSVAKTWENVFNDHADVKELVPEFYQPPGDFLLNLMNLNLGVRTDGIRVNDVMVPPWAKDANDFTQKCQEALECPYVSERLHHWIDLIFGYKQIGEEAKKADNLFHFLTYETNITYTHHHDPAMLAAIELQIKEFGQTPRQLFKSPHPRKVVERPQQLPVGNAERVPPPPEDDATPDSKFDQTEEWVMVDNNVGSNGLSGLVLKKHQLQKVHKDAVSAVKLSHDNNLVFSASHDKTLKVYQLSDSWQMLRSASISNLPLSSLAVLPDSKMVLVGSWDNSIYQYSVEFASSVPLSVAHDSSVTSVCWKNGYLVTGSWDSTVKVWQHSSSSHKAPELMYELDHDNEVTCVDLNHSASFMASGVSDGYVSIWDTEQQTKVFETKAHSKQVRAVVFSPDGQSLCSCGEDDTLKLFSVEELSELMAAKTDEPFHCMVWSGDRLLCGGESGDLHLLNASTLAPITRVKGHTGPITCLDISDDRHTIITGGKDRCIGSWSLS